MRLFISLEIPDKAREAVAIIEQNLKRAGLVARFVKPEIVHLTIAFLAAVDENALPLLKKIVGRTNSQLKPINLSFSTIDCFPGAESARIIFIQLAGEVDKLKMLARLLRGELKKEKIWFDEKSFHPHLTLARLKKRQNLTALIKKIKFKKIEFAADDIALIKSTLTSKGSVYKRLR